MAWECSSVTLVRCTGSHIPIASLHPLSPTKYGWGVSFTSDSHLNSWLRFTKGKSAGFIKSRGRNIDSRSCWMSLKFDRVLQCFGEPSQMSKPSDNRKDKSCDLETWRDLRKPADFALVKRTPGVAYTSHMLREASGSWSECQPDCQPQIVFL